MSGFFGRRALLDRIRELHRSNQHVSVVGARAIGKTSLLQAVVAHHANGSDLFAGAGIVDLRHDPPASTEAALRRVGSTLRDIFKTAAGGELAYLAEEVKPDASTEELYDQLKIALDMVAEGDRRILLVLDGCDPVLQNSAIPRNLWDNLRSLGQIKSLRFMTGSRDQLHRLCYNPEARTSDFVASSTTNPCSSARSIVLTGRTSTQHAGSGSTVPARRSWSTGPGGIRISWTRY